MGRKIQCPMLLLVSTGDDLDIHGDPETIWRPWVAGELRSRPIHSGHHQADEAPDELASALLQFLGKKSPALVSEGDLNAVIEKISPTYDDQPRNVV